MKRNLIIFSSLIFSLLLISMVYAGWFGFTGNSVKEYQNSADLELKKGLANKINLDDEEIFIKAPIIEKDSAMININGEIKEVKKGSPITIGDYEIQFISSEKGFLKRTKSKVKISRKKRIPATPYIENNGGNSTNSSLGNFTQAVTYQGVLDMLNKCEHMSMSPGSSGMTGDSLCGTIKKTGIATMMAKPLGGIEKISFIECSKPLSNNSTDNIISAICCSP